MSRFGVDTAPHIPAAGKSAQTSEFTSAKCLKFDEPETPTHVKPWRRKCGVPVGVKHTHPGYAGDPDPPDLRFGKATRMSETAQEILHPQQQSVFATKLEAAKEMYYQSRRKEPVGRQPQPSGRAAELAQRSDFRFGIKTTQQTAPTIMKQTLQPTDLELEMEAQEEYENSTQKDPIRERAAEVQKSVKANINRPSDVAAKKSRQYAWGDMDPGMHRFGSKPIANNGGNMAELLQPGKEAVRKTKFVRKVYDDHVETTKHHLGQPLNYGFGERNLPPDTVFGKPSKGFHHNPHHDSSAWACIRRYDNEDPTVGQPADEDLGRPRWYRTSDGINKQLCNTREEVAAVGAFGKEEVLNDEDLKMAVVRPQDCQAGSALRAVARRRGGYTGNVKTAGIPTVRTDKPKPANKKVTDPTNYGDDSNADRIVMGGNYSHVDVMKDDFSVALPQALLYELLDEANITFADDEKQAIWEVSAQMTSRHGGHAPHVNCEQQLGFQGNPLYAEQYPDKTEKATLADFLAAADMLGI